MWGHRSRTPSQACPTVSESVAGCADMKPQEGHSLRGLSVADTAGDELPCGPGVLCCGREGSLQRPLLTLEPPTWQGACSTAS